MSEKDKEQFLENPRDLHLRKIRSLLNREGFHEKQAKGSHFKIEGPDGRCYTVPLNKGDCKPFYKSELQKFYLSYQQ